MSQSNDSDFTGWHILPFVLGALTAIDLLFSNYTSGLNDCGNGWRVVVTVLSNPPSDCEDYRGIVFAGWSSEAA